MEQYLTNVYSNWPSIEFVFFFIVFGFIFLVLVNILNFFFRLRENRFFKMIVTNILILLCGFFVFIVGSYLRIVRFDLKWSWRTMIILLFFALLIVLPLNLIFFLFGDKPVQSKSSKVFITHYNFSPSSLNRFRVTPNWVVSLSSKKRFLTRQFGSRFSSNQFVSAISRGFDFFWQRPIIIIDILGLTVLLLMGLPMIFARPYAYSVGVAEGDYMVDAAQGVELEFTVPINPKALVLNVSPEVEGEWVFEDEFIISRYVKKAKFVPKESFYPGDKVIVYVVGMKRLFIRGNRHEQSLEFNAPKLPEIETLGIEDGQEDVPTDKEIELAFSSPTGDFVDWKYELIPSVEYSMIEDSDTAQRIKFNESLLQDTEYTFNIYRTPRSYSAEDKSDIQRGETEQVKSLKFKTVSAPLVAEYEPKGDAVLTDSIIRVVFDEPMDRSNVEENYSISPEVSGTVSWEDDRTFVFTPDQPLDKETKYEIVFNKGILNKNGGETEQEIRISFVTVGRVQVSSFSPVSGSSGHDPNGVKTISVNFNQEVDKASAQSHFSISPSVSGSFSWDGNTMIYNFSEGLSYSTQYVATVSAGVKSIHGIDSDKNFSGSFTTKSQIVRLDVPMYYQGSGTFYCNVVCTKMALAYRGVNLSTSSILSGIGYSGDPNSGWVDGYGVHWGPVANFISGYRSAEIKSGWNVADLAREVEKGNPVILFWYNRYSTPAGAFTLSSGATGYRGMHSEVVTGFAGSADNPTYLYTNDPWRGRLKYSRAGFVSTWAYLGYKAIVVY